MTGVDIITSPLPCEQNEPQTGVKTLPCSKLRLRAVNIVQYEFQQNVSTLFIHLGDSKYFNHKKIPGIRKFYDK